MTGEILVATGEDAKFFDFLQGAIESVRTQTPACAQDSVWVFMTVE